MSTALTDPPQTASLTAELARVLARIGRGLRYRTRAAREALDITHSESELLRLLDRHPGIRVHDAALELGVASNSVSTLVKQLNRAGLIERSSDPLDGRAACLRLTPQAEAWVRQLGNAREEAIARALLALEEPDRALIEAAIPALKHLGRAISTPATNGVAPQ
jgi:DNA-binding MarR family transcriptional regulator